MTNKFIVGIFQIEVFDNHIDLIKNLSPEDILFADNKTNAIDLIKNGKLKTGHRVSIQLLINDYDIEKILEKINALDENIFIRIYTIKNDMIDQMSYDALFKEYTKLKIENIELKNKIKTYGDSY